MDKAAYYKASSGTLLVLSDESNSNPSNVLSYSGMNNANFNDAADSPHTGNGGYTDPTNFVTPVGAFPWSPGPYGTCDMGGDVFQWSETGANREQYRRGLLVDPHQLHGLLRHPRRPAC